MTILPHQTVLSREERERIRRDLAGCAASESVSQRDFDAICDEFPRVLHDLGQAQRELGLAIERAVDAEARLANVPALVEALRKIAEAGSGIPDWRSMARLADKALAAWEAE